VVDVVFELVHEHIQAVEPGLDDLPVLRQCHPFDHRAQRLQFRRRPADHLGDFRIRRFDQQQILEYADPRAVQGDRVQILGIVSGARP